MDLPESTLVERARAGDARAFEALVDRHAAAVFGLALRTLGGVEDAEDAAQDAFVRAWRGLAGFRSDARFGTWLYRIATNVCYDRLPGLRSELEAVEIDAERDLPDARQDVDPVVLSAELGRRLHAAIDALPDGYRLLVTLRHMQDLSYNEIADITGLPLGTVKTGIHRARQRLRQALDAVDAPDARAGPAGAGIRAYNRTAPLDAARCEVQHV